MSSNYIHTPEEEALIEKAREWAGSPEGKASMEKIKKEAEERKKELAEMRKIDPEKLNKPMDF